MTEHPPQPVAGEDDLVRAHLGVVDQVVGSFRTRLPAHVHADDLRSAAHLGLLNAARSYDPSRGVPFAAYASTRMRGAVLDELRRVDWVSRRVRARARSLREETDAGRTMDEAATAAGMTRDEADRVLLDVRRGTVVSVEQCADEHPASLPSAGGRSPEALLLDRERHGYLRDAIVTLPERLRRVVVLTFLEEQPLATVAVELGVTESRVSHMRAEAVSMLRQAMTLSLTDGEPEVIATPPRGIAARRRAAYVRAVASASDYRERLSDAEFPVAV